MAFLLINQLKLLVVGFWISASCKARVHCVPQALVRSNLPRRLRHQTAFQMQTESDFATSYINISRLNGNILGMVPKSGHQAPKNIHFFYTVSIPSWFDPTKWRVYSAPDPVTLLLRCPYPLRWSNNQTVIMSLSFLEIGKSQWVVRIARGIISPTTSRSK